VLAAQRGWPVGANFEEDQRNRQPTAGITGAASGEMGGEATLEIHRGTGVEAAVGAAEDVDAGT
jgi:hypothetical protein